MRLIQLTVLFVSLGLSSNYPLVDLDADVIIIGAGMAGISATRRLQESGISNILVLEGRDRIGGRMDSFQLAGVTAPMGAGWIHGVDPNSPELHPLYKLGQECGGLRGVFTKVNFESITTYDSQSKELEHATFRYDDFETAEQAAEIQAEELALLGECESVPYRSALTQGGWTPVTDADNWLEWNKNDFYTGREPEVLSLCLILNDPTFTAFASPPNKVVSDFFVTDPNGFEKIVDCMADKALTMGDTRIVLNAVVKEIDTSSGSECVCVTVNSNNAARSYCAKYVITTVSTGVLQSGSIQFTPPLSTEKREVIQRFRLANYIHVYVQFTEAFWDTTEQIGYVASQRGYYPLFINHHFNYPDQPNLLMADLVADEAERILSQSNERTIAEIEQIFRTIYPTSNVKIVKLVVTDWINDPLFRGSFAYSPTEMKEGDRAALAVPVGNLYFSGSDISTNFSGYVHGAYYAGREAAESIIERENKDYKFEMSTFITVFRGFCLNCLKLKWWLLFDVCGVWACKLRTPCL